VRGIGKGGEEEGAQRGIMGLNEEVFSSGLSSLTPL
jgi:hypothetical protein